MFNNLINNCIRYMKFLNFGLKNYKGISKEIIIKVGDLCCFVGNNESGKTTILSGIEQIGKLCSGEKLVNGNRNKCRPKSTSFTGDIVFFADLSLEEGEAKKLALNSQDIIKISFTYKFENSQFAGDDEDVSEVFVNDIKITNQKKNKIIDFIKDNAPEIKYFDDFKFEVPEKIRFLKNTASVKEEEKKDKLLTDTKNIEWQHIFDDLLNEAVFPSSEERYKFQDQVVDWDVKYEIGDTSTIGNRMLGINKYLNKVVSTDWKDVNDSGAVFDEFYIDRKQNYDNSNFVDYVLRAKTTCNEYEIPERSKGCQWYFCFKVRTDIRANRNKRGIVFLLDEPASNLHIHPQQKILDSITDLSKKSNIAVIYSTHSPFLLDLSEENIDNTYIVENRSNDNDDKPNIEFNKLSEYKSENAQITLEPLIDNVLLKLLKKKDDENRSSFLGAIKSKCKTLYGCIEVANNLKDFLEPIIKKIQT